MNRSTFFKTLAAGIVAAPAAALAAEEPALPRRAGKLVCEIPPEAGKVLQMIQYQDHLIMACENGVYYWPTK